jgi:hypothetical protein
VTDLAYGGLFVQCEAKPDVATFIRVSVRVNDLVVEFRGVVRWVGECGVGVQFGALSDAEAHSIEVLLGLPHPERT